MNEISNTKNRLRRCIASVFNVPENILPDEPGVDNIDTWDSLAQLQVILAIETEFGVRFPSYSLADLISLSAFSQALEKLSQS